MQNLNLWFNKLYYADLPAPIDEGKNRRMFGAEFGEKDYCTSPLASLAGYNSFCMKTTYPGLLAGTGYIHDGGKMGGENDIECGFSFDYVTGQPYIPGSSVKGVLRNSFQHGEMITELLKIDLAQVKELESRIFGEKNNGNQGDDIFLDAVIRRAARGKRIMGPDTLAPHGKDVTKDPIPIQLIKVLPEVVFEFRFLLKNTKIGDNEIEAERKKELFISLLEISGIGAKTNVGYGRLIRA